MGASLEAASTLESLSSADASDQVDQMHTLVQMQALIHSLREQLVEREALDDLRWQMLEETRDELRQVRSRVLKLRRDFDNRLHQSDESRRSRQRELERQQGREFGWHRERELEQARWRGQKERPRASSG